MIIIFEECYILFRKLKNLDTDIDFLMTGFPEGNKS